MCPPRVSTAWRSTGGSGDMQAGGKRFELGKQDGHRLLDAGRNGAQGAGFRKADIRRNQLSCLFSLLWWIEYEK